MKHSSSNFLETGDKVICNNEEQGKGGLDNLDKGLAFFSSLETVQGHHFPKSSKTRLNLVCLARLEQLKDR